MDRLFERLLSTLNALATLWVVAIMLLITGDVIGRAVFNHPLPGVPEIVKLSIVGIVWLQMAFTLRTDRHLRSNLVFGAMPRRGQSLVYALNCLCGAFVFGIIVYYTYDDLLLTYERGTFEGEHPVRLPIWPVWALLVGGALISALEYLIQFAKTVFGGYLPALDEGPDAGDGDGDSEDDDTGHRRAAAPGAPGAGGRS
jgi:TRAP-type C4-dicarboxylate transport system permease small subunit